MKRFHESSWSAAEEEGLPDRDSFLFTHRWKIRAAAAVGGALLLAVVTNSITNSLQPAEKTVSTNSFHRAQKAALVKRRETQPRFFEGGKLSVWWDVIPESLVSASFQSTEPSNIHPDDYAGPESCRKCHKENYEGWSKHPHRWMNARADETTVKGDFSGQAEILYRGGRATFYQEHGQYRMRLERGTVTRVYAIAQTIGSRFYQYYIGKAIEAPEPPGHEFREIDHVLPFGYWLDQQEWVPIVHTHGVTLNDEHFPDDELPSDRRPDPFDGPGRSFAFVPYHRCNQCHTTFPLGDLMTNYADVVGRHAPLKMHLSMSSYLAETHPDAGEFTRHPAQMTDDKLYDLQFEMLKWEAPQHAATLGISCEACHMGCKDHATDKTKLPKFFPHSPHLHVQGHDSIDYGRTHENVNWICGRCHAGDRPQLAAGMATWNSTEYTDATRGSCYSQLKCIDCHDPHQAIGPRWTPTPLEDDQRCLKCHDEFESPDARRAHTHHSPENAGSRCMNCHMPRLNEGLQDVVRTHQIFSPTDRSMIEANQPNACNMCHTDQTIDWTLEHLNDWYGTEFSEQHIAANYPRREQPAAIGWLESRNSSVRLIAADTLTRTKSRWALPGLMDALDDPFLLNRQFARKGLEEMLDLRLDKFGYRYYMTTDERREPLDRLRAALLSSPEQDSDSPSEIKAE
jgi:predicted CXXCH cytochrome family protein